MRESQAPQSPRLPHAVKVVLAVTFGLAAAFLVGEFGLRLADAISEAAAAKGVVRSAQGGVVSPKDLRRVTPTGSRVRPNLDVVVNRHLFSGRNTRVRTNSLGMRGPEIPRRTPDEFRILVLADSIGFADYVDEHETYPAHLQERLQAGQGRRFIRVINGAGSNIGTLEQAELLAEFAPAVRPDLVLVGFYLNDSRGQAAYLDVVRLPPWLQWSELVRRGAVGWAQYRYSGSARRIHDWTRVFTDRRWRSDRAAYERLIALAEADWGAAWREESWTVVEAGFRRMLDLGRQHGFRVAVAAFPVSVQAESEFFDDRPQRRLQRLARHLSIPLLDLLPHLRGSQERHFYDQCHLTPRGNALVAIHLADFVRRITGH